MQVDFKSINFPSTKTTLCVVGMTSVIGLVWEHIARTKYPRSTFKPSVGMQTVAKQCTKGWTRLGSLVAKMSSYLTLVELNELMTTVKDFCMPIYDLIKSPLAFFKGYYDTAKTYMKKQWMIPLGTLMLIAMTGIAYYNNGFKLKYLAKMMKKVSKKMAD